MTSYNIHYEDGGPEAFGPLSSSLMGSLAMISQVSLMVLPHNLPHNTRLESLRSLLHRVYA